MNAHEAAARRDKAAELIAVIGDRPAAEVEGFGRDRWLQLARAANVRPPSPATIALVVAVYRERDRTAGDPFAGIPGAAR